MKKILLPILGAIGALLVALIFTFPMLSMQPRNVPVGVLSKDVGMTTPKGEMNAGEMFVGKITEGENPLINFEKVEDVNELEQGLDAGKYYATMVVPEDYTKQSATGEGKIIVTINEGLNAMVTMQLTAALNAMAEQSGLNLEINSINSVTTLGLKAMLLPMLLIMMTFIISLVTAFVITSCLKNEVKWKGYLAQAGYIVVIAFAIGFTVAGVAIGIAGVEIEVAKAGLFLSLVSLALMLISNGAIKLWGRKGLVVPVLLFILGIGTVQLPFEYLNEVWQVLVASWEPFRYIGNGMREVLYQGHGVWNSAAASIAALALVGIGLSFIDLCKKEKADKKAKKN